MKLMYYLFSGEKIETYPPGGWLALGTCRDSKDCLKQCEAMRVPFYGVKCERKPGSSSPDKYCLCKM